MKKAISISGAPQPIGPYSQAIWTGNMLFVSGQIPLNPVTGNLEITSIETATHQVMQNIRALVEEAGLTLSHVVKCSIFLTDFNDFSAVNQVYGSYFSDIPPARETVQVVQLPMNVPIEISCIAIKS
jgi:2-iminobutanoate/2-iminopropanoate deaminase